MTAKLAGRRSGSLTLGVVLRCVFRVSLAAVLLLGLFVLVAWQVNPTWLVELRQAFFTTMVQDRTVFEAAPAGLRALGFRTDPPALVAQWRERLTRELDYLRSLPADFASRSTVEKARAIVRLHSYDGGPKFDTRTLLVDKLRAIPYGFGVCSDHSEWFIALSSIFDIDSREVLTACNGHVTAAFYAYELNQWVWIDPLYSLMAKDPAGRCLSAVALRDAMLQGARIDPRQHPAYDDPNHLRDLALTFGNNVFEYDAYRERLLFLPLPVRQAILLAAGIMPSYRMLLDQHGHYAPRWLFIRRVGTPVIVALVLGLGAYPTWRVARKLHRRRPARQRSAVQASAHGRVGPCH
jgi:hypothetical protein